MIPMVLFATAILVRAAVGALFPGPAYPDLYPVAFRSGADASCFTELSNRASTSSAEGPAYFAISAECAP